jgi:hypothetical protein
MSQIIARGWSPMRLKEGGFPMAAMAVNSAADAFHQNVN